VPGHLIPAWTSDCCPGPLPETLEQLEQSDFFLLDSVQRVSGPGLATTHPAFPLSTTTEPAGKGRSLRIVGNSSAGNMGNQFVFCWLAEMN